MFLQLTIFFMPMKLQQILNNYDTFKEQHLKDRFFKHQDIDFLLQQLPNKFEINTLGKSFNGKSIKSVKWGFGKTKVMLWSQMHGNEATGTMAIFDLLNFLKETEQNETLLKDLESKVQLLFIPLVNPDGADVFTRRNAQQIDLNRDYLQELAPETKLLKNIRNSFEPHFGFNLHDQTTLWSVLDTGKPATLSFLAPPTNKSLDINAVRKSAMLVIAEIFKQIHNYIPEQIGLFDDEFEPRAFGDNFQHAGTSTILIEAGGLNSDYEKQEIRKYYFAAMLAGSISIANESYNNQTVENYTKIPANSKQIFHILIHKLSINGTQTSIGLNYEECVIEGGKNVINQYTVADIGDLSFYNAYQSYCADGYELIGDIQFEQQANFSLLNEQSTILSFKNGILL